MITNISPLRFGPRRRALPALFICLSALLLASQSVHAASTTWNATPGTADWATGTNWALGTAPGATGTLTNQDTATFLTNTNGNGTTSPVVIDATRNIKSITFGVGGGTAPAFTIGSTGGNSLLLSSGGAISITNNSGSAVETVNAPLVLEPLTSLTAGTYSFNNASGTVGNNLIIGGSVTGGSTSAGITLTLTGSSGPTGNEVQGIISDGGATGGVAVSKTSNAVWKLSGANTYTGGTTITAGTLSVATTGNLGASSSALTFDGGSLQITGTALTSMSGIGHTVTYNAGKAVGLDIATAGNTFTLDQALNATSSLTKFGAGTLDVTGANTYSGTTTVSSGTLKLSGTNSSAGATTLTAGTLQLNNVSNGGLASGTLNMAGSTLQSLLANQAVSNTVVLTNTTTVSGTNSITLNGSLTNSGGSRILNGSITGNTLTLAGNVYLSELTGTGRTLTIGGSGATVISGNIADFNGAGTAGILSIANTSSTTLSGANTYSGGTILASSSGAIGAPVNVTTIGNVGGASSSLGTAGVLTIGSAGGNGQLVYTGVGETTDRVVNLGGNVAGTGGNAIITQSGSGALKFTSNFTSTGTGTKTITLQGSTAGTGEISGAIVDNLAGTNNTLLTKSGTGTWTLSGLNTYSGATTINAGVLSINTIQNVGGGASSLGAPTTIANGTIALVGGTLKFTGSSSGSSDRVINLAGGTTDTLDASGTATFALSGGITGNRALFLQGSGLGTESGNIAVTNQALTKNGTGTWILSGTNSYTTGITTVSQGTLEFANPGSLYNSLTTNWTAAHLITQSGATLAFNVGTGGFTSGQIDTLKTNLIGGGTASAGFEAGSTIGLDTTGQDFTYNTAIGNNSVSGAIGLTKLGTNTLTLGGVNTYTGATIISAGKLALGAAGAINANSAITVASGATFDTSAQSYTFSTLKTTTIGINGTAAGLITAAAVTFSSANLAFDFGSTSTLLSSYTVLTTTGITGDFTGVSATGTSISGSFISAGSGNWTLASGGYNLTFSESLGTLTAAAIPEPATYALFGGVVSLLGTVWLRRRRQVRA